jgi:regulator of sigma E protease
MFIIIFLIILAVLILTHELGHFIFAKLSGVKVEEFGFGFPPKLFSFRRGETLYSVNAIPFGGFVKIYGENNEGIDDKRSFISQKNYIKTLILVAGVLFNLLLTWPIFTAGYLIGTPVSVDNSGISGGSLSNRGVMILEVQANTPAEAVGLKPGDYLLKFSSNKETLVVSDIKSVQNFIAQHTGKEIQIDYSRGGKNFSAKATPLENPAPGNGSLGIAMDYVATLKLPFLQAVWEGLKTTIRLTGLVAQALGNFFVHIFINKEVLNQVAGPVGIATIVSNTAQSGFIFILQLIALLSINLALINIIPFPALDGGRLLFLLIEFIKGKPISQKTTNLANNIGFSILIILMLIITYRDILRLF